MLWIIFGSAKPLNIFIIEVTKEGGGVTNLEGYDATREVLD